MQRGKNTVFASRQVRFWGHTVNVACDNDNLWNNFNCYPRLQKYATGQFTVNFHYQ